MNSILITGCNRGLGLGLIKTLIKIEKKPKFIFATCRNLEKAVELRQLADEHRNIHVYEMELCQINQHDNLIKYIEDAVKDEGLNVLFNNAGSAPKSTRINLVKEQDLIQTFQTNTVAPIMLAKACIPLLKKASQHNEALPMGVNRAAIVNMSSILASIESNKDGGMYAYRTTKTALNAGTKSLSIDLKNSKILCVCLHPGWVRTDLGGPKAPMDVETSCTNMIETLSKLTEKDNGTFLQHDGKKLPW